MSNEISDTIIHFKKDDWLIDKNNPGQPGQYTGKWRKAGPHILLQLIFPDGSSSSRPLTCLELIKKTKGTIEDRLESGHFGKIRDLQRLITYEKLKGILHEVIYSMEAAQIDFYPYQFKPVLKFINSPTERLIIADEVGLGKTIESALIWQELQARRQAKRLLVVCPKLLADKWCDELRSKFLIDARVVNFEDLKKEINYLKKEGPEHSFTLVASYTGIRPPKAELQNLKEQPDEQQNVSPKTSFLQEVRNWDLGFDPFDLVIFDEAHYMRNPATTTFHLGSSLAQTAGAVLCVSATPVNNSNVDLHSLLRLTDEDFFETQGMFEDLLDANRPTVQASNALSKNPVDISLLMSAVEGMNASPFIKKSPLFKQFQGILEEINFTDKAKIAKCQELAEKLNLLGNYVNRTRRVQVKENRPLRDAKVITVVYSKEEMQLYNTILRLVRARCNKDNKPFHVFRVLGLQLRAASCLPAIAEEIRNGQLGDPEELLSEAFGEETLSGFDDDLADEEFDKLSFSMLLKYDFEKNDSKYQQLLNMVVNLIPEEKILIFAYYRPTLAYLRRRLTADGITVTVIHGGIPIENRWKEIDRFKDPKGPRVLLSSEVGSEGIDLQFCRVMTNYDLPWNPMRVEQRIGRIDRVGQQAKKLSIVNFKVRGTIEERLYDRLHSKLERFANSLGDLEAVIGNEIQSLTVDLLSKKLSKEEEQKLIEQSEQVIEERLLHIQALETEGDALIALSDYVQQKIEESREKGRYIQPGELEDYLSDFFEREFQGTVINFNTPVDGCMHVKPSNDAHSSLLNFIKDDKSLSARPFRGKEFIITFRREVLQKLSFGQQKKINFVNHLSPLIRWITKINAEKAHNFYDVAALKIKDSCLHPGDYCYRIERWKLKGLFKREMLAYSVTDLYSKTVFSGDESERIVQKLLQESKDWDYVGCDKEKLLEAHNKAADELCRRFDEAVVDFEAENDTSYQIKEQRVRSIFDRRISQDRQRLKTLHEGNRDPKIIRLAEARLNTGIKNKEQRLAEISEKAKTYVEPSQVAAGVFRVMG